MMELGLFACTFDSTYLRSRLPQSDSPKVSTIAHFTNYKISRAIFPNLISSIVLEISPNESALVTTGNANVALLIAYSFFGKQPNLLKP